jgi:hypothetical protein
MKLHAVWMGIALLAAPAVLAACGDDDGTATSGGGAGGRDSTGSGSSSTTTATATSTSATTGPGGTGGGEGDGGGGASPGHVELAATTSPWGIAVHDIHVYWTTGLDGRVMKVPIGGGAAEPLAEGLSNPTAIDLGGGSAWVGAEGLRKIALDGGIDEQATPTPITQAVRVHGDTVFFSAGPEVWFLPIAGGPVTEVAGGSSFVLAIAADATRVYWTASAGNIQSAPREAGGPLATLASGQTSPHGIAVDATHLYWTNQGTAPDYLDGAIVRLPLDGSGEPEELATGEVQPMQLVVDDDTLFWVGRGGAVRRMPASGGALTSLFEGPPGPRAIAVDATNVYWVNETEGTVEKIGR